MPKTKRVQVLMEPSEFDLLERAARKRGSSVSDLMREAARAQFLATGDSSSNERAVKTFLSLPDVTVQDWGSVKTELEQRRGKAIP